MSSELKTPLPVKGHWIQILRRSYITGGPRYRDGARRSPCRAWFFQNPILPEDGCVRSSSHEDRHLQNRLTGALL